LNAVSSIDNNSINVKLSQGLDAIASLPLPPSHAVMRRVYGLVIDGLLKRPRRDWRIFQSRIPWRLNISKIWNRNLKEPGRVGSR